MSKQNVPGGRPRSGRGLMNALASQLSVIGNEMWGRIDKEEPVEHETHAPKPRREKPTINHQARYRKLHNKKRKALLHGPFVIIAEDAEGIAVSRMPFKRPRKATAMRTSELLRNAA